MSEFKHKNHNMTVLLYYLVFPAKYRRAGLDAGVDRAITEICVQIEKYYEIKCLEIGADEDHIHFLVQSVPIYSIAKLVTMIKSLSAREVKKNALMLKSSYGGDCFSLMVILQVR